VTFHCRKKRREKLCSYYEVLRKREEQFVKNLNHKCMDIEDVIRFGYEKHICPYYYQRAIAGKVDLVLMPYNYIIEPGMAK
jgi:regulator of telomere elongation helicase 1